MKLTDKIKNTTKAVVLSTLIAVGGVGAAKAQDSKSNLIYNLNRDIVGKVVYNKQFWGTPFGVDFIVNFEFNKAGKLVKEEFDYFDKETGNFDKLVDRTIKYKYDQEGRLLEKFDDNFWDPMSEIKISKKEEYEYVTKGWVYPHNKKAIPIKELNSIKVTEHWYSTYYKGNEVELVETYRTDSKGFTIDRGEGKISKIIERNPACNPPLKKGYKFARRY